MIICISSKGKDLNSEVDPRFGRCPYFLIINTEEMEKITCISNESAMTAGGAGIQAAQTVTKAGVEVVITGNIGPNAFQTLSSAGIKIFTGATGTIKEIVEKYDKDEFTEIQAPNVGSHAGMRG